MMERCKGLRFDAVGGLVMGAYPVAIAVSDAFYRHGQNEVRAFVIRKEPKKHGLRKRIEGDVKDGEKVLIVDDVITSGESTMEAIQQSREAGLEVSRAIAIIDREEQNGRQAIEAQGVKFEALFRLSDLSAAYQAQNG
jgi:orotate phosphoribosyltransferase